MRSALAIATLVALGCGSHDRTSPRDDPRTVPATPTTVHALQAPASPGAAREVRCTVRVSASGYFVDGAPMPFEAVTKACKKMTGAIVTIAEDAPSGAWDRLRGALLAARIPIYMRGVLDDLDCLNNPLAKGCR